MSLKVDIYKEYKNFILDMSFSASSRRIGILGSSGSGKTLTLRTIAGIHSPDRGRIVLGDRVLFDSANHINLRPQVRNIGYLFQNYALFPNMTVRENILAGVNAGGITAGNRGMGSNEISAFFHNKTRSKTSSFWGRIRQDTAEKNRRVEEIIDKFDLNSVRDHYPHQLSGGQQQRTALARIMVGRPEMILLDEPYSALDWYLKDRMQLEMMEMLKDYDGMVIMVSHDRDEIYRFSEELLIVDDGKIEVNGETKEVYANPKSRAAAALTGCKNFSRAERLDDHHVKALDWGITLETSGVLPESFHHLGFRAHQFRPLYTREICGTEVRNAVRCNVVSEVSLQFERHYYIEPETEDSARERITWIVPRELGQVLDEKGLPEYLVLPEDDLLYLQ